MNKVTFYLFEEFSNFIEKTNKVHSNEISFEIIHKIVEE
jgi:hypothetical protein